MDGDDGRAPCRSTSRFRTAATSCCEARADADAGRFAVTTTSFYALGDGYTAWARYDHNRIDLVPERKTYKPGDTARIMIQSPWEQATALVTTEREGIRTASAVRADLDAAVHHRSDHRSRHSEHLRVGAARQRPHECSASSEAATGGPSSPENDASDPGKPSFRLGYVELKVEDATKRLTVAVAANKDEYRPANTAKVTWT